MHVSWKPRTCAASRYWTLLKSKTHCAADGKVSASLPRLPLATGILIESWEPCSSALEKEFGDLSTRAYSARRPPFCLPAGKATAGPALSPILLNKLFLRGLPAVGAGRAFFCVLFSLPFFLKDGARGRALIFSPSEHVSLHGAGKLRESRTGARTKYIFLASPNVSRALGPKKRRCL